MNKKELFKDAHRLAKKIKNKYKEINYKFQFGLCLKYLKTKATAFKSGNDIRKEFIQNKDLIKAIVDTTTLLLNASQNILDKIPTNYKIDNTDIKRGILDTIVIDVVSIITKIENKERIKKCVYKAKFENKIDIDFLPSQQFGLWGKYITLK